MLKINLETWPRREHFKVYSAFSNPHIGLCASVDVTAYRAAVKALGASFNIATVYLIARAANDFPEFRQRIRPGEVVEHEVVHPSTTVLAQGELFSFCTFEYVASFPLFATAAAETIAMRQEQPTLKDEPGRDDLLFLTAIPWVSFTSIMHPLHLHPVDSVPRISWGKFFQEGDTYKMPLSVQGHHALVDGVHGGRYYEAIQGYLNRPEEALGGS